MKPRASFAWRRLRRLEFGLDSCSTFGAVDWYLKAILPVRLLVRSGEMGRLNTDGPAAAPLRSCRTVEVSRVHACMML